MASGLTLPTPDKTDLPLDYRSLVFRKFFAVYTTDSHKMLRLANGIRDLLDEHRSIDPRYAPLLLTGLLRVSHGNPEKADAFLERAPKLTSMTPDILAIALEAAQTISEKDMETALVIAEASPRLIDKGLPAYQSLVKNLTALAGRCPKAGRALAERTAELWTKYDSGTYAELCNSASRLSDKHEMLGPVFVKNVLELLSTNTRVPYAQVMESFEQLADTNPYLCAGFIPIAPGLLSLHEGAHYHTVVQDVLHVGKKNRQAALTLAQRARAILSTEDGVLYELIVKDVLELSPHGVIAWEWMERGLPLLEAEGQTAYSDILRIVKLSTSKETEWAWYIANHAQVLFKRLREIGPQYVAPALETLKTLAEQDGKTAARFAEKIPDWLSESLREGPEYGLLLLEAVKRVGRVEARAAYDLANRAPRLIQNRERNYHDADVLLIDSIRDPKDAQIVSPLIDKETHREAYRKRIRGFY